MRYIKKVSAEKQVRVFLENAGKRIYSFDAIADIIDRNRVAWSLAPTVPVINLVNRFVVHGILNQIEIDLGQENKIQRYIYGEPDVYEIATSLYNKSYISHYPAMSLHGLTNQVPKTIYVTHEQSMKLKRLGSLNQKAIDHAFTLPQRRSETLALYNDFSIVVLNGMFTNRLGVITNTGTKSGFSYTGLERTLLDITVRPNYSGGAFAVLDAYKGAKDMGISINKLSAFLNQIEYTYPYHQAIGFYLKRAGYAATQLEIFKKKPMPYKFYLDYQMENKQYDADWQIYYPTGM